jgi:hypothetical protein
MIRKSMPSGDFAANQPYFTAFDFRLIGAPRGGLRFRRLTSVLDRARQSVVGRSAFAELLNMLEGNSGKRPN